MKKWVLVFSLGCMLSVSALVQAQCFILSDGNKIIKQEGDCESRHAPCSTFKIAISLMGYNEKILIDEDHPELPFKEGYDAWLEKWKQPHTPKLWMKNSCIWFSRVVTQKTGMEKFKSYLKAFDYGNQDASGDKGKNNGITNAWLSSSLEISPKEQIIFIQRLLNNQLPVSAYSQKMTRTILSVEDLPKGWKMHGKTGSGVLLSPDRMSKTEIQIGWYVGWIEKEGRVITFVQYREDDRVQETFAGPRVLEDTRMKLIKFIETLG